MKLPAGPAVGCVSQANGGATTMWAALQGFLPFRSQFLLSRNMRNRYLVAVDVAAPASQFQLAMAIKASAELLSQKRSIRPKTDFKVELVHLVTAARPNWMQCPPRRLTNSGVSLRTCDGVRPWEERQPVWCLMRAFEIPETALRNRLSNFQWGRLMDSDRPC